MNGTAAAIPRLIIALLENGVRFKNQLGGTEGGEGGKGGGEAEITGLELPGVLKRFWVGGDEVGDGKERGKIWWTDPK